MRGLKNSYVSMAGWGLLLAGALSFASCSSDETIDGIDMQGKAITFGNVSIKENSRAVDPSYSAKDIASFQVWGTVTGNAGSALIFDGATISKGTAAYGEVWTQADGQTQYWISGADYEFLAIVDGNKPGVTTTKLADTEPKMPESIAYTADGETDLLCQKVSRPQNSDDSVVAFTFTHLLSKVHFTFQTTSAGSFNIADIEVKGHFASGQYTIAGGSWESQTVATTALSFGDATGVTSTTSQTSADACLIIPGTQSLSVSFSKTYILNGKVMNTEPVTANLENYTFEANKEYNILVTLEGGSEITFIIESLKGWDTDENGNSKDQQDIEVDL